MKDGKKNIIVTNEAVIMCKNGIMGPITNPYREKISVIAKMLNENLNVYEVLGDGTKIALDFNNLEEDFEANITPVSNTIITPKTIVLDEELVTDDPTPVTINEYNKNKKKR